VPLWAGDVVGDSQFVPSGTMILQENRVLVRASARLADLHSTKGRTHDAEDLFGTIGQSETEIR
jgi:hypothetical protein